MRVSPTIRWVGPCGRCAWSMPVRCAGTCPVPPTLKRHSPAGRCAAPARRGKYLWLTLSEADGTLADEALVVHLGMSGQLLVRDEPGGEARIVNLRRARPLMSSRGTCAWRSN